MKSVKNVTSVLNNFMVTSMLYDKHGVSSRLRLEH